jgi:penicillin-binding protein 2
VAATVLLARAGYLQLVKGQAYTLLSEENRLSLRLLPPPRGKLLDRKGVPLALNQQSYRAVILREDVKNLDQTLTRFADVIDLSPEDRARIQQDLQNAKNFAPIILKTNLAWNEMAKVEVLTPELPGVAVDTADQRFYPLGAATAHVIGYMGTPTVQEENDAEDDAEENLLALPGFQIGKAGFEKQQEDELRGTAGGLQLEVNAKGRVIREIRRAPPVPGKDLQMTLDADLQKFMYERLGQERSAASIVMDIQNGGIYAMASSPAYDPNVFSHGISNDLWQELMTDPTQPLLNKIFGGVYPPGSTFKLMTAMAALESNAITPDTTVFCPGFTTLGNHVFHCWKKGGHGTVSLHMGIAQSCDCYFYEVARRTGIDNIAKTARKFGLGEPSGLALMGERTGLIPDRAWKRKNYKQDWSTAETFVCGIGQGYITASILQLCLMTARIANGGKLVKPTLLVSETRNVTPAYLGFDADNIARVMAGMVGVTSPGGAANSAQIPVEQFHMAGKTGTAQVRHVTQAERDAGYDVFKLPWEQRPHALFVAYAPIDNPRYASATIIQHGSAGAAVAGPVARDIMRRVQEIDPAGVFANAQPMGAPNAN